MSNVDVGFVQHLIHGGKYWVLQVLDDQWPVILTRYLWPYLPEDAEAEDGEQGAYMVKFEGHDHYFISKELVPSHVLAKMLGVPVHKIYESQVIGLGKLEMTGDVNAKPTVDYCGEA